MWESIFEALQKLGDVNTFTIIVVIGLVAIANWLIKLLTNSTGFAILFTPAMIFGALAANYLFFEYYVTPTQDKNSNIVIASALGRVDRNGFHAACDARRRCLIRQSP